MLNKIFDEVETRYLLEFDSVSNPILNIRYGYLIKWCFNNFIFDRGGGTKSRHFQGCLRVRSRGHQVRGHPCKFAIFYHAEKKI